MGNLTDLLLGILGSLIAADIVFRHMNWCRRIIHAAARRLDDPKLREIKLEEWLAALNDHVGVFARFAHAISCWMIAPVVASTFAAFRTAAREAAHSDAAYREKSAWGLEDEPLMAAKKMAPKRNQQKRAATIEERLLGEERLLEAADEFRTAAEKLPPGPQRELLLEKARRAKTAAYLFNWLTSVDLLPPR